MFSFKEIPSIRLFISFLFRKERVRNDATLKYFNKPKAKVPKT